MTKSYHRTFSVRLVNSLMERLIRLGLGPKRTHLLTVRGRKSGKRYSTPVSIVEEDGTRYLVSPYGEVSWVKNARANEEVSLSKGGDTQTYRIVELEPEQAAPILKTYIQRESITRPYFNVSEDAPVAQFVPEAPQHPVFQLEPK